MEPTAEETAKRVCACVWGVGGKAGLRVQTALVQVTAQRAGPALRLP